MVTFALGPGGRRLLGALCPLLCLSVMACGSRVPPPGGPVDEFPPRIVSIEPESNRVRVDLQAAMRIEFDEEIMPVKGREMVRIRPRPPRLKRKYHWRGIEIRPGKGLSPECTYCVEVSGDIRDLRGNLLGTPLKYCFSTGDSIHHGKVTGSLEFPDSLGGSPIFQATHMPDSLVYQVPIGAGGTFTLDHLPRGLYHFLAYMDVDRDGRFEPLTDLWVDRRGELTGGAIELKLELDEPDHGH